MERARAIVPGNMPNRAVPDMKQLGQYNVTKPGAWETFTDPLYSSELYPAAGTEVLTFFQSTVGSAGGPSGGNYSLEDTNMRSQGELSKGREQLVTGVSFYILPELDVTNAINEAGTEFATPPEWANDVYKLLKRGFIDFHILEKSFLTEGPLMRFPPPTRMYLESMGVGAAPGAANATAIYAEYASGTGQENRINPLLLTSNQVFNVTLNFPNGNQTVSADLVVKCFLKGLKYRQVQ